MSNGNNINSKLFIYNIIKSKMLIYFIYKKIFLLLFLEVYIFNKLLNKNCLISNNIINF